MRLARRISVVALLALLVLVAWRLVAESGAPRPLAPLAEREATPVAQVEAATLESAAEAGEIIDAREDAVATGEAGFPLLVLDAESGTPVADAKVSWATWTWRDAPQHAGFWSSLDREADDLAEFERGVRARGQHTRTDTEGRAVLSIDAETLDVVASCEGRWGRIASWSVTGWQTEGATLYLHEDGDLVVRVIGADGATRADVPVSVRRRVSELAEGWEPVELHSRTDAEGVALMRHARARVAELLHRWRQPPRPANAGDAYKWFVGVDACLGASVELRLDPEAWPTAPLELALPPTGEVEVRLVDASGLPVEVDWPVLLIQTKEVEPVPQWATEPSRGLWPPGAAVVPTKRGSAVTRDVGLELDLRAFAQRNDASAGQWTTFEGPRAPGERVQATIVFGRDSVTLRGRLVTEEGLPLASEEVLMDVHSGPAPGRKRVWGLSEEDYFYARGGKVRTDGSGSFEADFALECPLGGRPLLALLHDLDEPACRSARLELDDVWSPGTHDLGDVVLAPSPVLAAGRVVDERGRPLAGAQLRISVPKQISRYTATTDEEGRFALRGPTPYASIALDVRRSGHAPQYVHGIHPGAEDVEVVCPTAGGLELRLVLPPDLEVDDVGWSLQRTDGGTYSATGGFVDDGVHADDELEPGRYALTLHDGGPRVLHRVADLRVIAGEVTELTIDLHGAARALRLTIVGPDGAPVPAGSYLVRPSSVTTVDDLWTARRLEDFERGEIRLTPVDAAVDVSVAAPGYRLAHFAGIDSSRELQLEAALRVEVLASRPVGDVPEGCAVLVELVGRAELREVQRFSRLSFESEPLGADGRALLLAPGPGTYGVRWSLRRYRPGGYSGRSWDAGDVTLGDSTGTQTLVLEPPFAPEALESDR